MLSPYQPPPQYLPFNGSISPAFFRVLQPLPSRMLRLAMITLPVPSSFSVVNPKVAFHSSRPICALFLPFLFLSSSSSVRHISSVSTSTPSPGPLHPFKAEHPPRHHPQEVPPSGAVISLQASMSISLFFPSTNHPLIATSSRSGHVVIGGMGTNGQPLSDVWVRPTNMRAVAQPQFTTIFRNSTTTANSGPRSIRHQAPLRRPPSKVQQVESTRMSHSINPRLCQPTPST